MTDRGFRNLLWIYVSLVVAAMVASAFPPHSDALQAAVAQESTSWLSDHAWARGGAVAILLVGWLAGLVGLFRFKRWGRSLSLYFTFAGFLIYPFLDSSLYWGLEIGLYESSGMLWGAILALAYFSPVSARFERQLIGQAEALGTA
jgi:hypothetical protein